MGEWDQDDLEAADVGESAENWDGGTPAGDTPAGDTPEINPACGTDGEMTVCLSSQETDISKPGETRSSSPEGNTEDAVSTNVGPTEGGPPDDGPNEVNALSGEAPNKTANDDSSACANPSTDVADKNTDAVTDECVLPDTDLTQQSDVAAGDAATSMNDIFERLGFCSMNMQVFQELRQTFGNEECEYCGRLFYSKSDHEAHIRTHTGE